jgi:hypothetical protein
MTIRTIILALAIPVSDETGEVFPAVEQYLHDEGVEDVQVVGVLDQTKPENNYEPQIFAAYHYEKALADYTGKTLLPNPEKYNRDNVPPPGPESCCATKPVEPGESGRECACG